MVKEQIQKGKKIMVRPLYGEGAEKMENAVSATDGIFGKVLQAKRP